MSIAVCPGSFDPITLGHVDVVRRGRTMFDHIIVGVAHNAAKNYMFSPEERVRLAQESLEGIDGVTVEIVPGLLVDFAKQAGASAIIKGLRGAADFDNEQSMALLNRHMGSIETVFIMGAPHLAHIASSYVKDIARYSGDFDDLVPPAVARAIRERKDTNV